MKLNKLLLVQPKTQVFESADKIEQSLPNDAVMRYLPFQAFRSTMTPLWARSLQRRFRKVVSVFQTTASATQLPRIKFVKSTAPRQARRR